jgi:hypothetical protein
MTMEMWKFSQPLDKRNNMPRRIGLKNLTKNGKGVREAFAGLDTLRFVGEKFMMTARDFKYWLRGWIELGGALRFTQYTLTTIVNHLDLVGEDDEFIIWLDGAISAAVGVKKDCSSGFFKVVSDRLCEEFTKVTPEAKKEIKSAVDAIVMDNAKLKKIADNLKDLRACRPLDSVGPAIYHPGSFVDTHGTSYTVYC